MKKLRFLSLILTAILCIPLFAACNVGGGGEFEAALNPDNFNNFTLMSSDAAMQAMICKKESNKEYMLIEISGVKYMESYAVINADDSKDFYRMSQDSLFGGEYSYYKHIFSNKDIVDIVIVLPAIPSLTDIQKEDFNKKSGYYVLTDSAKTSEKYTIFARRLGAKPDNFSLKLKIASNKLTEMIIEIKSGETTKLLKHLFTDYGTTVVTEPDWLYLCEVEKPSGIFVLDEFSMTVNGINISGKVSDLATNEGLDTETKLMLSMLATMTLEFKGDEVTVSMGALSETVKFKMDGNKVIPLDDDGNEEDSVGSSMIYQGGKLIITAVDEETGINIQLIFIKV